MDCRFKHHFFLFVSAASMWTLLMLTVDRYIYIKKPLHYPIIMTKCRTWCMLLAALLLALILTGLASLAFKLPPRDPKGQICAATHVTKPWFQLLLVFSLLAGMITSAAIYAVIFIKFRSSKRRLEAMRKENESQNCHQFAKNVNKDILHEVPGIHDQQVQITKIKCVDGKSSDNAVIFNKTVPIKQRKFRSNSAVKQLKLIGSHVKTARYILIL